MKLKAAEISAEGVRLQAMYIGHTILFMENITFYEGFSFQNFKISTEISATGVQDYLQTPWCLSKRDQFVD